MAALTRRTLLAGLSSIAALRPDRALAAWPERNITLMHGLAPGGGVDVSARLIAEGLSRRLGQQIVVEPKPGAAGTLMAAQVSRVTPDGHTLGYIPSGFAVSAAMYKSLPYRPTEDFAFIGQVLQFPFVFVTYPEHPIGNLPDLIKTAKSRTEPLLCGVPGQGTPQHLLIEYFMRLANIKIQPVPFRGGNQALAELLGKRLDFLIDPPIALIGQIKSGALRAIAVTGDMRFADLPGMWHHLTFPIDQLTEDSFTDGFGFDGSSLRGWASIHESDMLLMPDPSRFWIDPFTEDTTLCLIANAVEPITREAYAFDPRGADASAEAQLLARDGAYSIRLTDTNFPELDADDLELWLIEPDDAGNPVDVAPVSLVDPDDDGTYDVPAGLDPGTHYVVDISIEPRDGDATHSGQSILRGALQPI